MITTAKNLRIKTKAVLDAVARGQEVIVTHRGRACAKIVPIATKREKASDRGSQASSLFGIWRDRKATEDVRAYVDKLRKKR